MTSTITTIRLSRDEIDYLNNADFLKPLQIDTLRRAESLNDASTILRLSHDLAEEFRDAFTVQLAQVGFDEKYDTTSEGQILENLIDRFYVP